MHKIAFWSVMCLPGTGRILFVVENLAIPAVSFP
jgi:hypothetical protein